MEKKNRILVTRRGEVNALAALFKVDRSTVWNALSGKTQSKTVERIRKAALNRGAVEIVNNQ